MKKIKKMPIISAGGGRSELVDCIKGVGIALVVIGHSGCPFGNIIYLFHMALFFILSGYCYREKEISLVEWTIRKMKTLWLPHFLSVVIIILLTNILIDLHVVASDIYARLTVKRLIIEVVKAALFGGGGQLLGANWFLRTLFFGLMLYEVVDRTIRKVNINNVVIRLAIGVFFLTIGWLMTSRFGYGMYFNIFTVPILLEIGRNIKERNMIQSCMKSNRFYTLLAISCFACLIVLSHFGKISLNHNIIENPIFFVLCSIMGFFLCTWVNNVVLSISLNWGKMLSILGKNSLIIMLLHFVSFKIVTLLQIYIYQDDIDMLTSYPVYRYYSGWWIAYSLAGILIPCLIASAGKNLLKSKKNVIKYREHRI